MEEMEKTEAPPGGELLPCPFCGTGMDPEISVTGRVDGVVTILCNSCGIETRGFVHVATAKQFWNRRWPADGVATLNEARAKVGLPPLSESDALCDCGRADGCARCNHHYLLHGDPKARPVLGVLTDPAFKRRTADHDKAHDPDPWWWTR